jgi:crotonobetainyl-CoA:carnitine CoA-transferase CaiB-like acyl-CoA transferase
MSMALEGIRVLEWGHWHQGPLAARILGDLGAEVVKIEERVGGDPMRGLGRIMGATTGIHGRNCVFEHHNRNKKSITLDMTKESGKEIVYKLVEKSDVFIQNMRKGVAERLGMGYETLSRYNPRLIYATGSGWGPKGPISNMPSYDLVGQARSGIMTVAVEPGTPPMPLRGGVGDQMGGIMTAFAIMVALLVRERQGISQEVEASLLGALTHLLSLNLEFRLAMGHEFAPFVRARAGNPLWNHYKCKDDKWIMLAMAQSDRHWPGVCKALSLEHLEKDPKFSTMEERGQNAAELVSIMDAVFATKTGAEWLEILRNSGDLVFEAVHTMSDVAEDPQMRANDYIIDYEHPALGRMSITGFPVHFSQTPESVRMPAPEFGEHTEEVLQNTLGFTWEELTKLKDEEVI